MIRRMRLKFFGVTSVIVVLMVLLFCGSILISTHLRDRAFANEVLDRLVDAYEKMRADPSFGEEPSNKGEPPEGGEQGGDSNIVFKWQKNDSRAFVVLVEENGEIKFPLSTSTYFAPEEINGLANTIAQTGKLDGFLVRVKQIDNTKIIAAIDMSIENDAFNRLLLTVILLGGGGIIVMLVLVWLLSYWIVQPAVTSLEKQKRFISEASHELKTPLTVISAGIELLQKQKANNSETKKWLDNIKAQTEKMTIMTTDLLRFSRIEETEQIIKKEFNISQTAMSTALTFESVAYEQGKEMVVDVEEGILYKGDSASVSQAITILCDNAIKHSDEKGIIYVRMERQNSKIFLEVANTGGNISPDEIPLLFERFYRGSESRAEKQGTGLGLAILKTLAEKNNWKVNVKVNTGKVTFSIIF